MLCCIDVGSNTVRMLLCKLDHSGRLEPVVRRQSVTRLAGGMSEGCLDSSSMARTVAAISEFIALAEDYPIDSVRAVATAATRRASNAERFLHLVRAETGVDIEVIDGTEEARLTTLGVQSVVGPSLDPLLVFDLGGASLELSYCEAGLQRWSSSFPVGVVGLAESADRNMLENLIESVLEAVRNERLMDKLLRGDCALVGTAGTVTTLAALHLNMSVYQTEQVNNQVLALDEIEAIQKMLLPLDVESRELLPCVEAGRGDLIVYGLEFVLAMMRSLQKEQLTVSDGGLLEGIAVDLLMPR